MEITLTLKGHPWISGSAWGAWGDTREPDQPSQGSQTGEDDASIPEAKEDADSFGRGALDATQGYLHDAKAKASAAGKKTDNMKGQAAI